MRVCCLLVIVLTLLLVFLGLFVLSDLFRYALSKLQVMKLLLSMFLSGRAALIFTPAFKDTRRSLLAGSAAADGVKSRFHSFQDLNFKTRGQEHNSILIVIRLATPQPSLLLWRHHHFIDPWSLLDWVVHWVKAKRSLISMTINWLCGAQTVFLCHNDVLGWPFRILCSLQSNWQVAAACVACQQICATSWDLLNRRQTFLVLVKHLHFGSNWTSRPWLRIRWFAAVARSLPLVSSIRGRFLVTTRSRCSSFGLSELL